MNLEPAVLVMHHSMRTHPQITATLLDFLTRLMNNFHPSSGDQVHVCVTTAFQQVREKGVLPLLTPLLFNKTLNHSLRKMLIQNFQSLYLMENPPVQKPIPVHENLNSSEVPTVQFSESDDDNSDNEKLVMMDEIIPNGMNNSEPAKLPTVGEKNESLKDILSKLETVPKVNDGQKSSLLSEVMKIIISCPVFSEDSKLLAETLSDTLSTQFEGKLFPASTSTPSQSSVQLCRAQPVFSLFQCLSDPRRGPVMELLANLQFLQPKVGYCLIFYLIASSETEVSSDDKTSIYTEFCQSLGTDCSLAACLVRDLTQCQNDDVDLFLYLVPPLFDLLPHSTLGNVDLLYLIVSCVDGSQILSLVSQIVSQKLTLLHGDTCQSILDASLSWETFEQFAFWQIYNAHDLPMSSILNFLPKLFGKTNSEALTSVMLIIKKKQPTVEILSKCIKREPADEFLSSLCSFWNKYCEEKLASMVVLFNSKYLNHEEASKKRKTDQEKPMTLQLLGHFTPVLKSCPELFERPAVLEVFSKLSQSCLETTRETHSEFFEGVRGRESPNIPEESDEDSEEQSTEDDPSPQPNPKRKKTIPLKKPRRQSANINHREVNSSDDEEEEEQIMPQKKRKYVY